MESSKILMKNQIKKQLKHTVENKRLKLMTINGR